MSEIYVPVKGYEGLYEVSNKGNVKRVITKRSRKERLLKPALSSGYYTVALCKENKATTMSIHRLLALHFLPPVEGKTNVNHKNGIRTDNRLDNLEWCTHQENISHSRQVLRKGVGVNNHIAKFDKESLFSLYLDYFGYKHKPTDLARKYNVSFPAVLNIIKGRRYCHELEEFAKIVS